MNPHRPPSGGLFRLSGPSTRSGDGGDVRSEAREAIRHFVRVLERLDRDTSQRRPARSSREKRT